MPQAPQGSVLLRPVPRTRPPPTPVLAVPALPGPGQRCGQDLGACLLGLRWRQEACLGGAPEERGAGRGCWQDRGREQLREVEGCWAVGLGRGDEGRAAGGTPRTGRQGEGRCCFLARPGLGSWRGPTGGRGQSPPSGTRLEPVLRAGGALHPTSSSVEWSIRGSGAGWGLLPGLMSPPAHTRGQGTAPGSQLPSEVPSTAPSPWGLAVCSRTRTHTENLGAHSSPAWSSRHTTLRALGQGGGGPGSGVLRLPPAHSQPSPVLRGDSKLSLQGPLTPHCL